MTAESMSLTEYRSRTATSRLGLWLFILSDAFVFAGLLVSRFYLLGTTHRPELEQVVGLVVTIMLLVSSVLMNRAELSMANGDQKNFERYILGTIVLGTLFVIGVIGVEWQIAPFSTTDGPAASLFYSMTGFHAFHVLTGVIFLISVYLKGRKGYYTADRHWGVEAAAVYWHFVDVVWIFFYPALYLIGRPLL